MGYAWRSKAITDPPYIPTDQMLGVVSILGDGAPSLSTEFKTLLGVDARQIARLAKQYVFRPQDVHSGRREICFTNAKVMI